MKILVLSALLVLAPAWSMAQQAAQPAGKTVAKSAAKSTAAKPAQTAKAKAKPQAAVVAKAGVEQTFAGLLPGRAVMQSRLAALGLQEVDLPGGRLSGHTFHYSRTETPLAPCLHARRPDGGEGEAIYRYGPIIASYVHFWFPSNPVAAAGLFGA